MIRVLVFVVIGTLALMATLVARRGSIHGRTWLTLAFVAFAALPLTITGFGAWAHLERSKSTEFCLSCHEMTPYGRSLLVDDADALPASHAQNNRVPADHACYSCHTTYTMYGDLEAKLKGARHVWVHYLGEAPQEIALYEPYQNRECLYCHAGARSFEENEMHIDERQALDDGDTSCLDCHDIAHDVAGLDDASFWQPARGGTP